MEPLSESSVVSILTTILMALVSIVATLASVWATRHQLRHSHKMQLRKERIEAYSEFISVANKCNMVKPESKPSMELIAEVSSAAFKAIALSPEGIREEILRLQGTILDAAGDKRSPATIYLSIQATIDFTVHISKELDSTLSEPVKRKWWQAIHKGR